MPLVGKLLNSLRSSRVLVYAHSTGLSHLLYRRRRQQAKIWNVDLLPSGFNSYLIALVFVLYCYRYFGKGNNQKRERSWLPSIFIISETWASVCPCPPWKQSPALGFQVKLHRHPFPFPFPRTVWVLHQQLRVTVTASDSALRLRCNLLLNLVAHLISCH